jgi:hypothetical protein
MKIISHGYRPGEGVQMVVRHGLWPFRWFRIYYGKADQWHYKAKGDRLYVRGNLKARLTAHYWRKYMEAD